MNSDPAQNVLSPAAIPNQEPLIRLVADLLESGQYGERVLEVTKESVDVLDRSGTRIAQVPVADIHNARNEPVVGGGRLEITTHDGEKLVLISYTHTIAARFSEAARGIEQLAKGEELLINLKPQKTHCEKCRRLLPEVDGVCPACVNRGKTLLRIAQFMVPYKWRAISLTGLAFITTLLNLVPPILQGRLIDEVLQKHTNLDLLYQLVLVWLGIVVMATFVNITRDRIVAYLAGNIAADCGQRFIERSSSYSSPTLTRNRSGQSLPESRQIPTGFGDF